MGWSQFKNTIYSKTLFSFYCVCGNEPFGMFFVLDRLKRATQVFYKPKLDKVFSPGGCDLVPYRVVLSFSSVNDIGQVFENAVNEVV